MQLDLDYNEEITEDEVFAQIIRASKNEKDTRPIRGVPESQTFFGPNDCDEFSEESRSRLVRSNIFKLKLFFFVLLLDLPVKNSFFIERH